MHPIIERFRRQTPPPTQRPPLSIADIEEAERRLGFPLPELLRELYTEIGDGGFGPSYGLLPLLTPVEEVKLMNANLPRIESAIELYILFKKGDPGDPSWLWPDRLLPILDWGCAIRSCVDCSTLSLPIIRDEPYVRRITESPSFERWLENWLNGLDLWPIRES